MSAKTVTQFSIFHVGYPISRTHLRFIVFYHCTYVLIYSAPQLQECLINLLTYLSTQLNDHIPLIFVKLGISVYPLVY